MKVGESVTFQDEDGRPYVIRAMGPRFAVLTRPVTEHDCELFELDYEKQKGGCMYTLLDSQEWVRGPDHWVFGKYDYNTEEGCLQSLSELESGVCEISRRNMVRALIEE